MNKYKNIPTNIISGFLGAGKTTAIRYLLKHKPEAQRWAVIVNEFGQIGIDGALLQNDKVEIKEIPGGCLCCVGSQSLNVGLNQIIKKHRPQRIIIEPTGLGHPEKLLKSLTGEFYKTVLDLKALINLIDARQLNDPRYANHEAFIDQIRLADVLVANKLDTYSEEDKRMFYDFSKDCLPPKLKVVMVEQARLQLEWLDLEHSDNRHALYPELHKYHSHQENNVDTDVCGTNPADWLMVEGHASDYHSVGWKINKRFQFQPESLSQWFDEIFNVQSVERIKGVIHTDSGCLMINQTRNERQIEQSGVCSASVLEIIAADKIQSEKLNVQLKKLLTEQ